MPPKRERSPTPSPPRTPKHQKLSTTPSTASTAATAIDNGSQKGSPVHESYMSTPSSAHESREVLMGYNTPTTIPYSATKDYLYPHPNSKSNTNISPLYTPESANKHRKKGGKKTRSIRRYKKQTIKRRQT